jgi:hypothetical protein
MYRQLTIIQRIAFKGWIKHPETRPKSFDSTSHKYFDGLHMLWILRGFEDAVNEFFRYP